MNPSTTIKVLGLGGGGSNAINRMIEFGVQGVDFIAANTDAQALAKSVAPTKLLLGQRARRGLGAGGDPANGEAAAEESANQIREALAGADLVFLTAGMGGGTGTGAIPVAACIARELGAITLAIVTMPFAFEANKRYRNAQSGLAKLREHCHSLIVVPNDKLLTIVDRSVTLPDALRVADEVLRQGVQGLAELITRPSHINVDFANVCALMQMPGGAFLAMGAGKGPHKTVEAVSEMLNHKLLEAETLAQAGGVLVHFTGGNDLTLHEVNQAMLMIRKAIPDEAMFVMGVMNEEAMTGRVQVILVATGVGAAALPEPIMRREAAPVRPELQPLPASLTTACPPTFDRQPEPALAQTLFAGVQSSATRLEVRMTAEPPLVAAVSLPAYTPDNLDLPAFLRRRRGIVSLK